jgi:hypothetical protein
MRLSVAKSANENDEKILNPKKYPLLGSASRSIDFCLMNQSYIRPESVLSWDLVNHI